ncbi:AMIN-like domain-containing (lipo)protein [Amycolatopsis jejuensis]|uniref:AMIN-like domain-containing (lipo)protein n=1 Tax=Amycolatopsis jejuensis TaxID=330084 RepID=UPI00068E7337|nr:hypothetical protein [Amycolatopsis jejuensis]
MPVFAGVLVLSSCSGPASVPAPTSSVPVTSAAPTATPVPSTSDSKPATSRPGCVQDWGTGTKESAGSTRNALYLVKASRHECYDEVVFTINGADEVGYVVRYVPLVTADPSDAPLPVAGNAVLQVVIRAPAQGTDDSGHQPGRVLAKTGDYFAQPAGWDSVRAVRFAGSFEGQCTIAIGVRTKLPFRVTSQVRQADQIRLVVVDIAH